MTVHDESDKESFDKEGFLKNIQQWNETMAIAIAKAENIELYDAHWELIHCARAYFQQFDISPEMRPFVKWVGQQLDKDKGRSIYLLSLFPQSPTKLISKIAGLPKPANCI
ncbi:MAG: TusE/DsrC/DsvC family sulfur relay protein [Pseudomonadales bacterium]|nr:TusE/DsrC/DsvC family sulfur relay protein [Pseudomonadales bacterium]